MPTIDGPSSLSSAVRSSHGLTQRTIGLQFIRWIGLFGRRHWAAATCVMVTTRAAAPMQDINFAEMALILLLLRRSFAG